jgi:tetratricopeptide (TPR) repeat protein
MEKKTNTVKKSTEKKKSVKIERDNGKLKSGAKRKKNTPEKLPEIPEELLPEIGKLFEHLIKAIEEREIGSLQEAEQFILGELAGEENISDETDSEAMKLVRKAYFASPDKKIELAKEALSIDPNCVQAYNLLGDSSDSPFEAAEYYKKAMEAARHNIGEEEFKENAGYFWSIHETRSYMQAKLQYAEVLLVIGKVEEAIKEYYEMLTLNPGDNQGVRYFLANALLLTKRYDDLGKLLDKYGDEASAEWNYTRALWAYLKMGPGEEAVKYLKEAFDFNKYVPLYLAGIKKLPKDIIPFYTPGDNNEAILYVTNAKDIWKKSKGAIKWLKDVYTNYSKDLL